ncbi:hypothetical protein SQ56_28900 [Klebsiella variicola]|nr:hypothetical protein SQ56_28900 [Klebsiella variicola]
MYYAVCLQPINSVYWFVLFFCQWRKTVCLIPAKEGK